MADNFKYAQIQKKTLAGAGVSVGDNTMTLTNFLSIDGVPLTMADFGGVEGFGTVEPGSKGQEEQIRFTGIVQNLNGTATLTGISNVSFLYPYTQTANFQKSHAGGTPFIITNTSGFYNTFANKKNDEDMFGVTWRVDDPTVSKQIANKDYVDNAVIGGGVPASPTNPGISMEGTQSQVDTGTQSATYLGNPYELFVNPAKLRARQFNSYASAGGTANAITITVPNLTGGYTVGDIYVTKITSQNTGATTLSVNGNTAQSVVKNVSSPLTGGELTTGQIVAFMFDGTNFQILSISSVYTNSSLYFTDSANYTDNSGGSVTLNSFNIPANLITNSNTVRVTFIGQLIKNAGADGVFDIKLNSTTIYTVASGANSQPLDVKLTIEIYKNGTSINAYIVEQSWDSISAVERTNYQLSTTAITTSTAVTFSVVSSQTGTPGGATSTEYLLKSSNS